MKKIIDFIKGVKNEFEESQIHFLTKQLKRVSESQPYKGLKLLHNIPFTKETIVKLEILYAGGADISMMSPSFMEVDETLKKAFVEAGGIWIDSLENETKQYDICLDCAGELLGKTIPKIGTVEITGTGTHKYGMANVAYPVISVDQSTIKKLEGVLGTGEAFVRAFKELTQEEISNKSFMIFGYGKVGRGIAHYLKNYTSDITIIDKDKEVLHQAKKNGFNVIAADDTEEVQSKASDMYAIITATGINNVISQNYDTAYFLNAHLANMGGEDEFGTGFKESDVMCAKKPINFFIEHPTLMRYLDPVFYAHNMGVDILLYANLNQGLHSFPAFLSEEIVAEWETVYDEHLASINAE